MFKLPFLNSKAKKSDSNNRQIKLILSIGNPGEKYEKTYHNAGHLFLDSLTDKNFKAYKDFAYTKEDNLILVKSLTFMNQSGKAAKQALKYFGIKPYELLVVHDDSDLELGNYKIDFAKGTGGHNGIQSIKDHLKTKEFHRLRIGIRKHQGKAGDFVLKPMSKADLQTLEDLFPKINVPLQP